MIIFYSFCEALETMISGRKSAILRQIGLKVTIPSKFTLFAIISSLVGLHSLQLKAQSFSAATHNFLDEAGLSCAATNGVYSVVYNNTVVVTGPTQIHYITKQGKIKATASIARNEFTGVRSMIATSDGCALIAGYATGCDYVPPSSHYFLAKIDSSGNTLFSLNLLTSAIYNGATGISEDAADSSYYVYLPNKLVRVSKAGVVLYSGSCSGNYRLGKRFSNGDVIAVNSNNTLLYGDSVGFTNFYQQPLQGAAKKICVTRSNLIFVLTNIGIEKFSAQLQPMGTYTVGSSIDAIDLHNDTLFIAGVNNGKAFMQLTDTVFTPISQFTTTVNYLRPSSISAIQGKRAAINMTGRNQTVLTEWFSNLSITDNAGAFAFSNDVSIEAITVNNAYFTFAATAVPTVHVMYLHLDANIKVKNNGQDTLNNFYLSNVFYKPGICGIDFMHLPLSVPLASQGTVVIPTGMYSSFYGYYENAVVPATFTLPPICFYTSIPNNTADSNPDNDYLCTGLQTDVPVISNVLESTKGSVAVNLFPNPAQELVQINCAAEEFTYSISDALGRTCLEGIGSNSIDIDCKGLTSGIYFVTVKARGYSQQKKLVIQ